MQSTRIGGYFVFGLVVLSSCDRPTGEINAGTGIAAQEVGGTFTVLHTFGAGEGKAPRGALAELDGRLYGLNGEGGPNATDNCSSGANWNTIEHTSHCPGALFSLRLDGSDFRIEHAFTQLDANRQNLDGYHPYGSLAVGPDSKLYGVTQTGGTPTGAPGFILPGFGVLFSFDPATGAFTTLHSFFAVPSALDGEYPMGIAAIDASGNVYGSAKGGGASSAGTVWRYSPDGSFAYSALTGENYGGVALANGLLHGTTWQGGANGAGVYFTADPSTMAVTIVDSFPAFTFNDHGTDNTPIQAPLGVSDGTVLAAREFGGAHGTGLVVRLSPATGITVLHDSEDIPLSAVPRFSNATGGMLNGQLAEGRDGLIYGTAQYGGASGTGAIYRIARNGALFQLLYSFPDAAYPYGGLIVGSDGALYGMEFVAGLVFRFTPPIDACP
ncbi:MAG TPA: choice-of-anchor tandem repeat GloVer-containing protein [Kofleriaceae bacterium]|jgi:uncharacterized repeat protein (TIGR03803 family)